VKVSALMAEEPAGEAEVLRVAIQGGGCSGFEYALGFDRGAQSGDHELQFHGVRVVVDPFSAPYLQGSTIDFLEGLQESGFKIENPNAVGSCGCGHSFQVAEGEDQGSQEQGATQGLVDLVAEHALGAALQVDDPLGAGVGAVLQDDALVLHGLAERVEDELALVGRVDSDRDELHGTSSGGWWCELRGAAGL